MELCDFNLETYIASAWTSTVGQDLTTTAEVFDPWQRLEQVWAIMADITNGIMYIHSHNEVHRDLKPKNGIYYLSSN